MSDTENSGYVKKEVHIEHANLQQILGESDQYLKLIKNTFEVNFSGRGDPLTIEGELKNVELVEKLLTQLGKLIHQGFSLKNGDLKFIVRLVKEDADADLLDIFSTKNQIYTSKATINPKGIVQKEYAYAIKKYDLVFGIGPAGTGKTYIAMAMAISYLKKKLVSRIILARPAVEAGEKIGFLPGDMYEKVNPYLRPLYDALYDMMDIAKVSDFIERGIIEIAPLGFMRGRTLNDAFIILDEAQNTTSEQMKMFLTRLGYNSKAVVTGDVTQIDLPPSIGSGLVAAQSILERINEIKFIYFSERDVVRHSLVQSIIRAYGIKEAKIASNAPKKN